MKHNDVREDMVGFVARYGWKAPGFLESVRESKAFTHLPDGTIEQWLLGRLELVMFGQRRRSRYRPPKSVVSECAKCRGRGWFGRGKKQCPACNGNRFEPLPVPGKWIEPEPFTGYDKRRLLASMYELGLLQKRSAWVDRFHVAANWRTTECPEWVKHLSLPKKYSAEDKRQIMSRIRQAFEVRALSPKIEGHTLLKEDVFYESIGKHDTLIRLALTFGCTCPITGHFVPPDQVLHKGSHPQWDSITDYVEPLGFRAHKEIYKGSRHIQFHGPVNGLDERSFITVSPFSKKGINIIRRAVTKCANKLGGEISQEWVLAEVIQSMLPMVNNRRTQSELTRKGI